MIVELSKIKNVDELRKKATYQYNGNKQIEEMSEKGKLVYVTNENTRCSCRCNRVNIKFILNIKEFYKTEV